MSEPLSPLASSPLTPDPPKLVNAGQVPAVNSAGEVHTLKDEVVAQSRDFPDLVSKAETFDPELAKKFTGKAMLASKTFWGMLAVTVLSQLVVHFNLGWNQEFVNLVAGAIVLATAVGLRMISEHPITGLFRAKTTAEVTGSGAKPQ